MKPIECSNLHCFNVFIPKRKTQKYCCLKCGMEAHNAQRKVRAQKQKETNQKQQKAWDDINAFMKRYTEETGRYISYGKAVMLMEQEKRARK